MWIVCCRQPPTVLATQERRLCAGRSLSSSVLRIACRVPFVKALPTAGGAAKRFAPATMITLPPVPPGALDCHSNT